MLETAGLSSPPQASPLSFGASGARNLATPYSIAVVVGAVSVFISPIDLWWIPVGAMIWYVARGLPGAQKGGFTLEFADSFYYLGFTLTIGSLLASLNPFSGTTPNPTQILRYFGLGLFTTLVGVIGRTVLQMFYQTSDESIEATNQRISAVAQDYLGTLEEANRKATNLLNGTLTVLDGEMRSALEGVQRGAQAVSAAIEETSTSFRAFHVDPTELKTAMKDLGDSVRVGASGIRDHMTFLSALVKELSENTVALRTRVTELDEQVVSNARALGAEFRLLTTATGGLGANLPQLLTNASAISRVIHETSRALEGMLPSVVESAEKLGKGMAEAGGALEGLDKQVNALSIRSLDEKAKAVATSMDVLERAVRKGGEAMGATGLATITAAVQDTAKHARELNSVLDEIVEAVRVKLAQIK